MRTFKPTHKTNDNVFEVEYKYETDIDVYNTKTYTYSNKKIYEDKKGKYFKGHDNHYSKPVKYYLQDLIPLVNKDKWDELKRWCTDVVLKDLDIDTTNAKEFEDKTYLKLTLAKRFLLVRILNKIKELEQDE